MSGIDPMMKASTQSAPEEAKPIEKCGGGFKAAPPPSKNDLADDESETSCSTATAFAAKPAPSAGRPPLFRR
jgi:hypothetical protein